MDKKQKKSKKKAKKKEKKAGNFEIAFFLLFFCFFCFFFCFFKNCFFFAFFCFFCFLLGKKNHQLFLSPAHQFCYEMLETTFLSFCYALPRMLVGNQSPPKSWGSNTHRSSKRECFSHTSHTPTRLDLARFAKGLPSRQSKRVQHLLKQRKKSDGNPHVWPFWNWLRSGRR